tara:strand:+ start:65831 stop:66238 length:408 start_codon:yes stop_codon:yes gene_type:complete
MALKRENNSKFDKLVNIFNRYKIVKRQDLIKEFGIKKFNSCGERNYNFDYEMMVYDNYRQSLCTLGYIKICTPGIYRLLKFIPDSLNSYKVKVEVKRLREIREKEFASCLDNYCKRCFIQLNNRKEFYLHLKDNH